MKKSEAMFRGNRAGGLFFTTFPAQRIIVAALVFDRTHPAWWGWPFFMLGAALYWVIWPFGSELRKREEAAGRN